MGELRDFYRARRVAPYHDDALVGAVTRRLVEAGGYILQSHKLADNDPEHCEALLGYLNPPRRAHVLDVGCGIGAVALAMKLMRPDLRFTLLNYSPSQLAMCPAWERRVCGDMHVLPFADETFDAAMFTFSLGHGMLGPTMRSVARVLRPGGVLFIYDITTDEPAELVELMGYRPHRSDEVMEAAYRHGLELDAVIESPPTSNVDFLRIFGAESFHQHGFDRVWPVIYRFTA